MTKINESILKAIKKSDDIAKITLMNNLDHPLIVKAVRKKIRTTKNKDFLKWLIDSDCWMYYSKHHDGYFYALIANNRFDEEMMKKFILKQAPQDEKVYEVIRTTKDKVFLNKLIDIDCWLYESAYYNSYCNALLVNPQFDEIMTKKLILKRHPENSKLDEKISIMEDQVFLNYLINSESGKYYYNALINNPLCKNNQRLWSLREEAIALLNKRLESEKQNNYGLL